MHVALSQGHDIQELHPNDRRVCIGLSSLVIANPPSHSLVLSYLTLHDIHIHAMPILDYLIMNMLIVVKTVVEGVL